VKLTGNRLPNLLLAAGVLLTALGAFALKPILVPPPRHSAPAVLPASLGEGVPIEIVIADMDIRAPVVAVGTERNGALELPAIDEVGWWIGGATPTDTVGSIVLAGHVDDHTGPGALFALDRVGTGAVIELKTRTATTTYAVASVQQYRKQKLPAEVFRADGPHQLVLITCGGPFDYSTGHYRDNLVVIAAAM
jgi:hypothetical protein